MADRVSKIILKGDISDLQAKMVAAGKSVSAFGDKVTAQDKKAVQFRKGLTNVGDAGAKMGLVAAAGIGAVAAVTANFDKQMSAVQAATHASSDSMEALRQAAILAGRDTAFSASEAAQGIENLAKAGVSTKDILSGGLSGALDLAAAGTINVADAAEAAATAMTQFGLSGSDVPHIADLLAAAAGKAQGDVSDFNYALAQSGLVAHQVGLSIEETTGGLAAFASAGLLGSDAGTSFKTMLGALTPNSDKAEKAMQSLGLSAYDAQGNFVGLAEFAGRLRNSLKDMSNEQRQASLETIFGSDAVRAASVIYSQGAEGVQKWIDKVDDTGFAAETAGIKLDNLAGDFEQLKGSLETLFIGAGEGQQGFFRSLTKGATDGVNALNDLPESAKNTAVALLGVTAITGGAAWFGSRVVVGISNTREALKNLGVESINTRRAILGVAGVTAGLAVANSDLAEKTGLSNTASLALMGTVAGPWGTAIGGGIGLAKDFAAANNDLEAALRAADDAFTEGSVEAYEKALDDLRVAARKLADDGGLGGNFRRVVAFATGGLSDIQTTADGLEVGLRDAKNASGDLSDVIGSALGPAVGETGDSFHNAALSADEFKNTLESINAFLDKRSALRNYQEALDTFADNMSKRVELEKKITETERAGEQERAQLRKDAGKKGADQAAINDRISESYRRQKDAIAGVREEIANLPKGESNKTAAGRAGQEQLDTLVQRALTVASQLEGNERVNFLDRARARYIASAKTLGVSAGRAARDATASGLLEKDLPKPKVDVDTKPAKTRARHLRDDPVFTDPIDILVHAQIEDALKQVHRLQRAITGAGGKLDRASGGVAYGFATGGYTGNGAKYEPAGIVHRGEFVIDADNTRRHRALLESIQGNTANTYRAQRAQMRGYANGGYVEAAAFGIDYDRLAKALGSMRPVYGDVHMQPHNYSEFSRQMDQDRRQAAVGGVSFSG